jgi:hypothetical protein
MAGEARKHLRLSTELVAVLLVATGCGSLVPSSSPTTAPSLVIETETVDGLIGLARGDGALALLIADESGGLSQITVVDDRAGDTTIHIATLGGQTGRQINSFVFGNAPAGASRVDVTNEGASTGVSDGVFVLGLRERDLNPANLHWAFLAPDGTVILQGDGLRE